MNGTITGMINRRIIWGGVAAGVLCHILQGLAAYLIFDRFYLENPDIVRDATLLVGVYYLIINMILGIAVASLTWLLSSVWTEALWKIGLKAGFLIWAVSSPIWIIKRQILLRLSNWLLFEIVTDLIVYAVIGMVAGLLVGRRIGDREKETT